MTSTQSGLIETAGGAKLDAVEATRLILLNKRLILSLLLVGGIVGAVFALLLKPTFTANATFLPPNSLPNSSLANQLGQISSIASGGMLGGLKDTSTIYIGILGSRSVADDLIKEFNLAGVYHTKKLSQTERVLAGHTKFIPAKDSLITISVWDTSPKRASDLANAYLDALSKQNDRLALTEAAQRRAFFEQQLVNQKDRLADAEVALTRIQEQSGLIKPEGQALLQIETIAQTRAAIASRQIQLEALGQADTSQNPDVIRLQSEIEGLQKQLGDLENSQKKGGPGSIQVPTSKVPELTLSYIRADREVKFQQALYELLMRQFESAKLDESRSAPMMQVVDKAVVPDQKSGPPRTLLTIAGVVLGGLIGAGYVLVRAAYSRLAQDPISGPRLQSLHEAARFRL